MQKKMTKNSTRTSPSGGLPSAWTAKRLALSGKRQVMGSLFLATLLSAPAVHAKPVKITKTVSAKSKTTTSVIAKSKAPAKLGMAHGKKVADSHSPHAPLPAKAVTAPSALPNVVLPNVMSPAPATTESAANLDSLIANIQANDKLGEHSNDRAISNLVNNAVAAATPMVSNPSQGTILEAAKASAPYPEIQPESKSSGFFSSVGSTTNNIVGKALHYIGVPYTYGGTSVETGFDCSGYVRKVFHDTFGLLLPRRAVEMSNLGSSVKKEELKPGDLVFFNTLRNAFSHVGIYLGNNQFVHAPSSGGRVRVESMDIPYWQSRYEGARRVKEAQP